MYLLDTNHCSFILRREPSVIQRLDELGFVQIMTSVITQGELIYMAENSERREYNLGCVDAFLETIRVFNIDGATSKIYGRLKADLINQFASKEKRQRRRTKITDIGFDDNDVWIAAVALQHNLTIVSSDSDFQRLQSMCGLSLEVWYQPSIKTDS
ncbi:type II toxin-antitoxin system VapC family toxin [Leptolyngbya sp. NIES-2104]|uniref:type II toxin-antitoxin system VapC family toxin n=1 Tax=Leptolyngbya sp. NIES-2104 TaxID=1552121 RepID=UPI00073EE09B|nr:type II toxin-antitoxin system VapC family toxin [Leptolyngbya sp. NIES-2104]